MSGAIIGFITGVVLSTGPLSVPAFTFYGLMKGAFLSTEAASSLVLMVSKAVTFQRLGALPASAILQGLIIGSSVMAGAFVGKAIVQRMSLMMFEHVLDGLLFCSGVSLLCSSDCPEQRFLKRAAAAIRGRQFRRSQREARSRETAPAGLH